MAKRKLPKGKMKGKQKGSAVKVKGFSYKRGKKTIKVKGYSRGRAGGKRG